MRSSQRQFIANLKTRTADIAPEQIAFFAGSNRSAADTLFYLDKPKPGIAIRDANELKAFLQKESPKVLISRRKSIPDGLEKQLEEFPTIAEDVQQWDSKSKQRNKLVAWILKQPVNIEIKPAAKEKASNNEE